MKQSAVLLLLVSAIYLAVGCGARDPLKAGATADAGPMGGSGGNTTGCVADGVCSASESCADCPADCGLCVGCGDSVCQATESCSSCPEDCGVCDTCGDGSCDPVENCLVCAPDCGACPRCGDGSCDASESETCFTCPGDCGACVGCGDGDCAGSETCASCQRDCGVCSVCGNDVCEDFETCSNCAADCGECELLNCLDIVLCALGCVDLQANPPDFSITCVANCVSRGCADVQFFVDQMLSCAFVNLDQIADCSSSNPISCIEDVCGPELSACLGASCF